MKTLAFHYIRQKKLLSISNCIAISHNPELFGIFVVENEMFIPVHQTTELTLSHVFQTQSNHLREKDKTQMK